MSWGQRFEVINYQAYDIGERSVALHSSSTSQTSQTAKGM